MVLLRLLALVCGLGFGLNIYSYPGEGDQPTTMVQAERAAATRRMAKRARRICDAIAEARSPSSAISEELKELRSVVNGNQGMQRSAFGTVIYSIPHGYTLPGYEDVARDAKAILIGFGGAGVMSASGRTFMPDGYVFKKYGISMISFDYPFHANGPRSRRYQEAGEFMTMVAGIVRHYEKTGLPVYLMGHSFGPTVIQELLHHSPRKVRGAIYLSPGGSLSPEQGDIYRRLVSSGELPRYWDSMGIIEEPEGEPWSNRMERLFKANKGQDLSIRVPVELIAGKNDLYSTPETMHLLAQRYQNIRVGLVDGVGHDIFKLRGKLEKYVTEKVLDFIEREDGIILTETFKPGSPDRRTVHRVTGEGIAEVKYFYANSAMFRRWLDEHKRIPVRVFQNDDRKALGLMQDWRSDFKRIVRDAATQKLAITHAGSAIDILSRGKVASIVANSEQASLDYDGEQALVSYLID